MKKSTLIGMVLGALALASCSSYGGAHGGSYRGASSVYIGVHDYDYGYRSSFYRPGFYYHSGYYYPEVHPYYRNYHRNYRQWRHWNAHDWARYEHQHKNWRGYQNWHPGKHWQPRKNDRKGWARYERDRKEWRGKDRHPGRDANRNWRRGDRDRKDFKRSENRGGKAGVSRGYHNGNWGDRVKRGDRPSRDHRQRNR